MKITASELAVIVSGKLFGNKNVVLTGVNGLSVAKESEVSFLGNLKYLSEALKSKAGIIFIADGMDISQFTNKNIIKVPDPRYAYSIVLGIVEKERLRLEKKNIHFSASIANNVNMGINVCIGQNVVIETDTEIGDNVRILPNVYIGNNVKIGKNCLIYPNVFIGDYTVLGNRVIIHPGVVIGGDGFGFVTTNGKKIQKIPQIGKVEIGDDVEIGANTTVDRATVDVTKIDNGTKIDNLVQIGHNVKIGENCVIIAQVGISGSTHLGNNVTVGGQTGLVGHLKIGNDVMIAAQSGVTKNIKDYEKVGGNPIVPIKQSIKIRVLMKKLPEIYQNLKRIKGTLGDR
ncbi:MAG: UDP-3-O-(3-hydroxymyristoyl)glucosamine N-acyltransferase [Endomicrobium sp.]|jgi:UDP-3-O-[3-hydroxymyristoyl] glucosamine N-acyltransferase|nr:UDP-3-O-(3-hydroxymyristoyl)glucosamine N-acyltransferase [Endomicrobium sp.]